MEAVSFSSESLRTYLKKSEDDFRLDLFLKGVKCGHCVHKISNELQSLSSIENYQFTPGGERLSLWSKDKQAFPETIRAIQALGFEAIPLAEVDSTDEEKREFKRNLKKMAVAAVCAGNIMMFSTAVYLGADGDFVHFFHKLSFFLVLPTLIYSASSIWYGFWQSVRNLKFNLDFPIGLALAMGFVLSVWSFLVGGESIFFDSIAVVIFLVLTSRFVLNRYVNGIYQKNIVHFVPGVYQVRRLTESGEESLVSTEDIKKSDRVKVYRSETIPVDGILKSESAIVDQSVISGESRPLRLNQGEKVFAGSRLCVGECVIEVEQAGRDTRVGYYIENALKNQKQAKEESFVWVSRFTFLVVFASAATFVWLYLQSGLAMAFERSFAIVLVACPCAISFGIPLIRSFTGQLAMKNGVVLKKPQILRHLNAIKNLCFDKTGTLTQATSEVNAEDFYALSNQDQLKLLSLELAMDHPISNGFKAFLKEGMTLLPVEHFEYEPGVGIQGVMDGELWAVRSASLGKQKRLAVRKNEQTIGYVSLSSTLKKGLLPFFKELTDMGKTIHVLSGDEAEQVKQLEQFVPQSHRGQFLYNASPEDKLAVVEGMTKDCVMVGDGINDISAMKKAEVSVCMPGALENNINLADVSLTNGSLQAVLNVFKLSQLARRVELRLFSFTFLYNIICIVLAIAGYITPVVAAILMPISSITVLSLVTFSLRRL